MWNFAGVWCAFGVALCRIHNFSQYTGVVQQTPNRLEAKLSSGGPPDQATILLHKIITSTQLGCAESFFLNVKSYENSLELWHEEGSSMVPNVWNILPALEFLLWRFRFPRWNPLSKCFILFCHVRYSPSLESSGQCIEVPIISFCLKTSTRTQGRHQPGFDSSCATSMLHPFQRRQNVPSSRYRSCNDLKLQRSLVTCSFPCQWDYVGIGGFDLRECDEMAGVLIHLDSLGASDAWKWTDLFAIVALYISLL